MTRPETSGAPEETGAADRLNERARRLVVAAAVADAVGAWWPHRHEIDLPAFAAGRRLEDLAYGAGLWAGALRARDPRSLRPVAPPPVAAPPHPMR